MTFFYRVGSEVEGNDDSPDVTEHYPAGAVAGTTVNFKPCACVKGNFIATGVRGRCLFNTPQRYCCGGTDIPATEKCEFDPTLRCYCGREQILRSTLFLTICSTQKTD